MIKEWLAAAIGSVMMFGSSSAGMAQNDARPMKDRPASTTRHVSATDIACVGAAVAAREAALSSAMQTHGGAVLAAYTSRASALASAYGASDPKTVRTGVRKAWDDFGKAMKTAKKEWQSAREKAWSGFKAAVKQCGPANEQIADTGNASSESRGE